MLQKCIKHRSMLFSDLISQLYSINSTPAPQKYAETVVLRDGSSPVLERWMGQGLPCGWGTGASLWGSFTPSMAISTLDSSCSGMFPSSDEKGLSGFSRHISQLVLPESRFTEPLNHDRGLELIKVKDKYSSSINRIVLSERCIFKTSHGDTLKLRKQIKFLLRRSLTIILVIK